MKIVKKKKIYLDDEDYKRFKHWLIDNNMNVNDFAKKIGVHPNYITRHMKGQISVNAKVEKKFLNGGYRIFPTNDGKDE